MSLLEFKILCSHRPMELAYSPGSALVISEPDGKAKSTIPINGHVGLATPSPDGEYVAYLSFDPVPRRRIRLCSSGAEPSFGYFRWLTMEKPLPSQRKTQLHLRSKMVRQSRACIRSNCRWSFPRARANLENCGTRRFPPKSWTSQLALFSARLVDSTVGGCLRHK